MSRIQTLPLYVGCDDNRPRDRTSLWSRRYSEVVISGEDFSRFPCLVPKKDPCCVFEADEALAKPTFHQISMDTGASPPSLRARTTLDPMTSPAAMLRPRLASVRLQSSPEEDGGEPVFGSPEQRTVKLVCNPSGLLVPKASNLGLQTPLLSEEDEIDSVFGSPKSRTVECVRVLSPCVRPLAPKTFHFKSPPPEVSERSARVQKRERQEENVGLAAGLTYCELGEVSFPEFAALGTPLSGRTTTATEENRDGSPIAPADDFLTGPVESNSMLATRTMSQNSLRSLPSSLSICSQAGHRAGDTDTPPAGPHAFEAMATLVKCPAPKRARAIVSLRANALVARSMIDFESED